MSTIKFFFALSEKYNSCVGILLFTILFSIILTFFFCFYIPKKIEVHKSEIINNAIIEIIITFFTFNLGFISIKSSVILNPLLIFIFIYIIY